MHPMIIMAVTTLIAIVGGITVLRMEPDSPIPEILRD